MGPLSNRVHILISRGIRELTLPCTDMMIRHSVYKPGTERALMRTPSVSYTSIRNW